MANGVIDEEGVTGSAARVEKEFDEGFEFAQQSPLPDAGRRGPRRVRRRRLLGARSLALRRDGVDELDDDGSVSTGQSDDDRERVGGDTPQASPQTAAEQAAKAEGQPGRGAQEAAGPTKAEKDESEGGAAGHGAEPRGKRTDKGEATYLIAVAEAMWEEMERDERVFLLGEDIGVYGGAFKVTEGFIERFGPQRVWDTPIMEETIVGMSVGAAMEGFRRSRSSSTRTS